MKNKKKLFESENAFPAPAILFMTGVFEKKAAMLPKMFGLIV